MVIAYSVDSTLNQDIVAVLVLLANREITDIDIGGGLLPRIDTSKVPPQALAQLRDSMTPEMIERAKSLMTPENLKRIATMLKQQ